MKTFVLRTLAETIARWLLAPSLLVSGGLWLGISSLTANAAHVLAKFNFVLQPFGSVSVWLLASAIIWPAVVGCVLISAGQFPARRVVMHACVVAVWAVATVMLTAMGDEILNHLGPAAIAVWIVEIAVAGAYVHFANRPHCKLRLHRGAVSAIAALAWLTEAKALLVFLIPGLVIRI